METIILNNETPVALPGEENETTKQREQETLTAEEQEALDDQREIKVGNDVGEPDPEDDDLEPTGVAERTEYTFVDYLLNLGLIKAQPGNFMGLARALSGD